MDLKKKKIYNWLIAAGLATGVVLCLWKGGISGLLFFCSGALFPVLLLFPLFLVKGLGAGDIKLFSVIGGFLGISLVWKCMILSFILGAFLALFNILVRRQLSEYGHSFIQLYRCIKHKRLGNSITKDAGLHHIHFTIPIFLSTCFVLEGWI